MMPDRVGRFVAGLDSDYINACSTGALNDNMETLRIHALEQDIKDR